MQKSSKWSIFVSWKLNNNDTSEDNYNNNNNNNKYTVKRSYTKKYVDETNSGESFDSKPSYGKRVNIKDFKKQI